MRQGKSLHLKTGPKGVSLQKGELLISSAENILQGTVLAEMTLFSPNRGGEGLSVFPKLLLLSELFHGITLSWLLPCEIKYLSQCQTLVLVWSVVHLTVRRAGTQPEAYVSCSSHSPSSRQEPMTHRDLSHTGCFVPHVSARLCSHI